MRHHQLLDQPTSAVSAKSCDEGAFPKTTRILRLKQVLDRIGISRAQIYVLMGEGRFPNNFSLCGPSGRAVGWLESDVDEWVASRAQTQQCNIKSRSL
jgi:prophage regulatory protein